MISAALLAVPGASAYFLGGAVIYTAAARAALIDVSARRHESARACAPSTEAYAALLATRIRERHNATWGLGETGAAGPPATAMATMPAIPASRSRARPRAPITIETGDADRQANMRAFAKHALELLADAIR